MDESLSENEEVDVDLDMEEDDNYGEGKRAGGKARDKKEKKKKEPKELKEPKEDAGAGPVRKLEEKEGYTYLEALNVNGVAYAIGESPTPAPHPSRSLLSCVCCLMVVWVLPESLRLGRDAAAAIIRCFNGRIAWTGWSLMKAWTWELNLLRVFAHHFSFVGDFVQLKIGGDPLIFQIHQLWTDPR